MFRYKKKEDPDFSFFNRKKSHNTGYYKKTPGVKTSCKEKLESILSTTFPAQNQESDSSSKLSHQSEDQSCSSEHLQNHDTFAPLFNEELSVSERGDGLNVNVLKTKKRKSKQNFKPRKKRGNLSRQSKREIIREISRNNKKLSEKIYVRSLVEKLGNPWDSVSIIEKKKFALHFYYQQLQETGLNSKVKKMSREHAASLVGVSSLTIK